MPDCHLGVIAGTRTEIFAGGMSGLHDGKVRVESAHVPGMKAHLEVPVPHMSLPGDRRVWKATLGFLKEGEFPKQPRSLISRTNLQDRLPVSTDRAR